MSDVVTIEPGTAIWERIPDGANYDMRGGIVIEVDHRLDTETGEVRRVYVVLGTHHGTPVEHVLDEENIDRALTQHPRPRAILDAARRLCLENSRCKGNADSFEVRRGELITLLYGLLAADSFPTRLS